MAPPLDDLLVDHLGDLGHRVVVRPEQLIRLRGCRVVVQHLLQGEADVDDLRRY